MSSAEVPEKGGAAEIPEPEPEPEYPPLKFWFNTDVGSALPLFNPRSMQVDYSATAIGYRDAVLIKMSSAEVPEKGGAAETPEAETETEYPLLKFYFCEGDSGNRRVIRERTRALERAKMRARFRQSLLPQDTPWPLLPSAADELITMPGDDSDLPGFAEWCEIK